MCHINKYEVQRNNVADTSKSALTESRADVALSLNERDQPDPVRESSQQANQSYCHSLTDTEDLFIHSRVMYENSVYSK